jgi:hypothetical protein
LGVYGSNLFESVYMKPSPHTLVMEFFPDGTFTKDVEVVARALGFDYLAWWGNRLVLHYGIETLRDTHEIILILRKFSNQSLPLVRLPTTPSTVDAVPEKIPINAQGVIQAILEQARR